MSEDAMDDLTITRLCAEAMGYKYFGDNPHASGILVGGVVKEVSRYDPLHDDAQAMALVKKLRLRVLPQFNGSWCADTGEVSVAKYYICGADVDVNRAICLCVAKMMQAKRG